MRTWLAGAIAVLLGPQPATAAGPEDAYRLDIEPILENYCFSCHGEGISKGKFSMDEYQDLSGHLSDLNHWMSIWGNIRSQMMPPSDVDQLTIADKKRSSHGSSGRSSNSIPITRIPAQGDDPPPEPHGLPERGP